MVQIIGRRIFGVHVHHEVRFWSKKSHLTRRIPAGGAVGVGFHQFPIARRSAASSGEMRVCLLIKHLG